MIGRSLGRIVPHMILPVADMAEATAFYRGLGFEVEADSDTYAWVRHRDEEILHLDLVPDLDPDANPVTGYLHVRDADRWHRLWADQPTLTPVVDQPWDMREFTLTDPSGNTLRIGHNR
ncbi:bleomycin resistance protein [Euzebya rosea]|uniref:bleomycin resistance protein n=1 Tax=Euzebya rosea TaxID=2052804 RepID=UPI000DF3EE38|nr:VOC family protein [Euzebya rosea]